MLDRDLAELYGVETRVLNQSVRRNIDRFPFDFMFELTREEVLGISQIVTSSNLKFSRRVTAFTEQGVAARTEEMKTIKSTIHERTLITRISRFVPVRVISWIALRPV